MGEHDFTAFTPTETEHVRFSRRGVRGVLAARRPRTTVLEFWIEADAFMRHMNRVLVGTMLEVAGGGGAASFAGAPGRPRSEAGRPRRRTGLRPLWVGGEPVPTERPRERPATAGEVHTCGARSCLARHDRRGRTAGEARVA